MRDRCHTPNIREYFPLHLVANHLPLFIHSSQYTSIVFCCHLHLSTLCEEADRVSSCLERLLQPKWQSRFERAFVSIEKEDNHRFLLVYLGVFLGEALGPYE